MTLAASLGVLCKLRFLKALGTSALSLLANPKHSIYMERTGSTSPEYLALSLWREMRLLVSGEIACVYKTAAFWRRLVCSEEVGASDLLVGSNPLSGGGANGKLQPGDLTSI